MTAALAPRAGHERGTEPEIQAVYVLPLPLRAAARETGTTTQDTSKERSR